MWRRHNPFRRIISTVIFFILMLIFVRNAGPQLGGRDYNQQRFPVQTQQQYVYNDPNEEQSAVSIALQYIDSGSVPQGDLAVKWGAPFYNYERLLPAGATYREYRVNPPPGVEGPGARRIVVGNDGAVYYTNNHYRSFSRIR